MIQQLPPEVISLIYHVELNKVHWWEKGVGQLVLAILWIDENAMSVKEIVEHSLSNYSLKLSIPAVQEAIKGAGDMIVASGEKYTLIVTAREQIRKAVEETLTIEKHAANHFTTLLEDALPGKESFDTEECWNTFNNMLLKPLVREIGASAYNLLIGAHEGSSFEEEPLDDFLGVFPGKLHRGLRKAVHDFLSSRTTIVRGYMLRILYAYLFVEASGLTQKNLETLYNLTQENVVFDLYVDTNFILSLLNFRPELPYEASTLSNLVSGEKPDQVSMTFYALSTTVDEAKSVLKAAKAKAIALNLTDKSTAQALIDANGLSGVVLAYVYHFLESEHPVTPQQFYDPYINNLIVILQSHGVTYVNKPTSNYAEDKRVTDDTDGQLKFEKKEYGDRAKTREKLLHDMILWHFVKDQRPDEIEAVAMAESWLITLDKRLLGFDGYKLDQSKDDIPVCVHPTTLAQILQIWTPRTQQFEAAMFDSTNLPILARNVDAKTEAVTFQIVRVINQYEHMLLPTSVKAKILINDSLRQRLEQEDETAAQTELIREAFRDQYEGDLQQRVIAIEEQNKYISQYVEDRTRERQISRFVGLWIPPPIIAGISTLLLMSEINGWGARPVIGGLWGLVMVLWMWLVDKFGLQHTLIKDKPLFVHFHRFRLWIMGAFGTISAGVIVKSILELLI